MGSCISKEPPSVDVDVNIDVSGCNCCGFLSKKKKKKKAENDVVKADKIEQSQEVEKTDKKTHRVSTTIVFVHHDESKSDE
jgi:hypothetical protein